MGEQSGRVGEQSGGLGGTVGGGTVLGDTISTLAGLVGTVSSHYSSRRGMGRIFDLFCMVATAIVRKKNKTTKTRNSLDHERPLQIFGAL